ncbi:hypothetical protein [Sphingomonas sp.]|uniref:hypothetical protein n=1 Tax=Sphingomonas sp. TaxID=28214 RepID=UPI0028A5C3F6|nr:hypothetical protein [Sphingomonas sp.]
MVRSNAPLLAASVLALAPATARAAPEQVYQGTVGTAPVVMMLSEDKAEVFGQYFYLRSRLDIDLSGSVRGQTIDLASRVTGDKLHLTRSGTTLSGTLTTAKAKRLPVSLRPAGVAENLPADLPPKLSGYERWHLTGLTLTAQQAETINGKTIRWYREPLSGIRLFRIERGYAAPALAAVNHTLARNQWQDVSAWFGCIGYEGGPGTDVAEAQKPWLGTNHISYLWNASWSCAGAAHPDFATVGYSFDMHTGRELRLDDLLPFGPAPAEDSDAWYGYRGKRFAPGVVTLLKRYHPAEMTKPGRDDEDGCDYSDPDVWDFPGWALSDKGLWLGATFARVQRACDAPDWAILPWSALGLKPGEQP